LEIEFFFIDFYLCPSFWCQWNNNLWRKSTQFNCYINNIFCLIYIYITSDFSFVLQSRHV